MIRSCLLAFGLFLSFGAIAQNQSIFFVNGIQNTRKDASESARIIQERLSASTTRSAPSKKVFSVSYIWNPIGFDGSENGCDSCQDVEELFIQKTSEEHFAADFQKLTHSFRSPATLDIEAAKRVKAFYDDLTPGNNTLETNGTVNDSVLSPTKTALDVILAKLKNGKEKKIFVAHSQGNLLINLAWAAFVAEKGQDADNWVRFVNVANTSRLSIHNLNLTHAKDAALFSNATDTFDKDVSLEKLPSAGRNWNRTTPECANAACDFKIMAPTFEGVDGTTGTFDHAFIETYLSTTTLLPTPISPEISFSSGKTAFFDRFEDLIYAAATSLDEVNCGAISSPSVIGQQGPLYSATTGQLMRFTAIPKEKPGYPYGHYTWTTSDGGEGGGPTPEFSRTFMSSGQFTVTVTPILSDGTRCTLAAASSSVSVSLPKYSKISNAGALLADSASAGYGSNDWGCLRDNDNNYMYEIKMPNGARAASRRFTNYTNTTALQKYINYGAYAYVTQAEIDSPDNALSYVRMAQSSRWCGRSNWDLTGIATWSFPYRMVNADEISIWSTYQDGGFYCPYGGCDGYTGPPMSVYSQFGPIPFWPQWGFYNAVRSGPLGVILSSPPQ